MTVTIRKLGDAIGEAIAGLKSGKKLQIKVWEISESRMSSSPIRSQGDKVRETLRMLLFSVLNQEKKGEENEKMMYGITLREYELGEKTLVYIEKVDSTSARETFARGDESVSFIGSMIHAYVNWIVEQRGNVELYVFARAQPSFLFSLADKSRKALSHKNLILWWKRILSNLKEAKEKFIFVPNENELVFGREGWSWGLPYDSKAKVNEVVPLFPDDGKSRVVQDIKEVLTVEEMKGIVSLSQDFQNGQLGGFLCLKFSSEKEKEDIVEFLEEEKEKDLLGKIDGFLKGLDFHDEPSIVSSTQKFNNFMEQQGIKALSFSVAFVQGLFLQKKEAQHKPMAKVNDLSGLIKRKKPIATEQVNMLSSNSHTISNWNIVVEKGPILGSGEMDALSEEYPSIPDMVYSSRLILKRGNAQIEFSAKEALKQVDHSVESLKVAHSKNWQESRLEMIKETAVKPFDWTYSTRYRGTLSGLGCEETTEEIDIEMLKRRDPILLYDHFMLYEDELDDNGTCTLSIKFVYFWLM